jgi:hypothetical protein
MDRWIAILAIFLMVSVASAQEGVVRKTSNFSISSRSEFRTLTRSGEEDESSFTVSQLSIPLSVKYAVTRNIALDLLSTAIISSAEGDSLSGLRDLKARTVLMLADDRLMMSAGVNIPVGKSDLNSEEMGVSTVLTDRAMKFRYNNLGEGLDVSFNGGIAQQLGPLVVGAGAGYLKKGEYALLEDSDDEYHPGDQFAVTAGTDLTAGTLLLRADGTYTSYHPDKLNGEEVYQEEDKLAIQGTVFLNFVIQLLASGRYTMRVEPKLFQSDSLEEIESLHGDQIDAKGYLRFPFTDAFSAMLLGDFVRIEKNENGLNDAQVVGFGAGMTYRFTRFSRISLEGRYYLGTADDGKSSLDGFSGVCSIRLGF